MTGECPTEQRCNTHTHTQKQGREKDIIIFTTVRSSTRSVGFVADERRINVGLTRARCSLIVLANCTALAQDAVWGNLLAHARATGCMYATRRPFGAFLDSVLRGTIKPEAPGDIPEVRWCGLEVLMKISRTCSGHGAGR